MPSNAALAPAQAAAPTPPSYSTNGYLNRRMWSVPGTYPWVVPAGVTKIRAAVLGAGSSGASNIGGNGGALAIGEYTVTPGQTLNIVVGAGGKRVPYNVNTGLNGGTSSLVIGGTTVTANGAVFGVGAAAATASGGTLVNSSGGVSIGQASGGCSSGTPYGNGFHAGYFGYGGAGWGGGNNQLSTDSYTQPTYGGGGSAQPPNTRTGGGGLTALGGVDGQSQGNTNGGAMPWWDLFDIDGGGGGNGGNNGASGNDQRQGGQGGPGSGGGGNNSTAIIVSGSGGFGGGGGAGTYSFGGMGGLGGGGGASGNGNSSPGGAGGNGFVGIWY